MSRYTALIIECQYEDGWIAAVVPSKRVAAESNAALHIEACGPVCAGVFKSTRRAKKAAKKLIKQIEKKEKAL